MNHILCVPCFTFLFPKGAEEKTCSHGWWMGFSANYPTCLRCGAKNLTNKPPFRCLGSTERNPYG